ncbi:MAG: DnaD domain protein [Christensenellales bacterium]|jgi:DnaD/phage-associated family protein
MALCTFDREAAFFDVTPVENLFIEEYLRAAPGDFVKVYLFGLKQCYHPAGDNADLAGFARAVGLPAARVEEAFAYWCRQGTMRREGEGYAFVNLKGALLHGSGPAPAPEATPEAPSPYRAFNRQLTQACPGQIFSAYEMNRIYDWIEVFGLPQEVVLILIAHYAEKWRREKGKPVPVAYLDKVAKSWAEEGVTSAQAAREKTERSAAASSGAAQVLSRLGIRRLPTAEELALYEKWTGQMGFAPDGVIAACADTARLRQPSFADLDRTLGRLAELELSTGSQIKTYLAEAQKLDAKCREMLRELGRGDAPPTPAQLQRYMHFTGAMGFSHKMVLQAARRAAQGGPGTLEGVAAQLERFDQLHLTTVSALQQYEKQLQHLDFDLSAVLTRAGSPDKPITEGDRATFLRWTGDWGMSYEMVLQAADYATFAENKMAFINRILANWRQAGVTTLAQAQADHEARLAGGKGAGGAGLTKKLDFSKYEQQRTYTKEELNALYDDVENL